MLSKFHRIVYDFDHLLKAYASLKNITYYSVLRNIVFILIPFLFMKLFTVFVLAIHSIDFIKWGSIFLQAATFSYMIDLSDKIKDSYVILQEVFTYVHNTDFSMKGILHSLDSFYEQLRSNLRDFADYVLASAPRADKVSTPEAVPVSLDPGSNPIQEDGPRT